MQYTYLQENDQVALICPGSICTDPGHPALTQDYLKTHYQLNAIFDDHVIQGMHPSKRAQIFINYLFDKNIKLIGALRGGEGCADILPYIHQHYEEIKTLAPKILLGHSDFTALLVYFEKYYHWPVIHGPSVRQFAQRLLDMNSEKMTMDLLFGRNLEITLDNLKPLNKAALSDTVIQAKITGGNLSVLNISIKDLWEFNPNNKILFFEDCDEKAHKIIRTLKYFSRIGMFNTAKAVIFGDFTCWPIGCNKEEHETNRQAIIKTLSSFAAHHDLPVLYTSQFGHGTTNLPLIYSKMYKLRLGEKARLTINLA
ncbi:MAG: LD-carboxypeptidase [Proteobacteria bacterium]|nr:LD-carboxypeptidase [Pseudomonadota bacterium]